MSPLFKVGDLVVRSPEARGESGWPYDDAVCRVVDDYPDLGTVIDVVPVISPPNKRYQGTGWLADRFTPAYMFTGIEPPKEVMRITRDGIRVAVGVSVDEAAQAVLNALSVEIRRLVDVARADDTALLRQALDTLTYRLEYGEDCDSEWWIARVGSTEQIAYTVPVRPGVARANARRLVACWNACEGISTDALERLGTLDRAHGIGEHE